MPPVHETVGVFTVPDQTARNSEVGYMPIWTEYRTNEIKTILEKADEIFVFPADFGWSDLGTWGSLQSRLPHDINGNACVGDNVRMIESYNCIVHATQEKQVIVQGLDGYIVAEKDNALLICKLGDEQRIKEFLQLK